MRLLVLIQREYVERVRNKTFIISTILGLVMILGLSFAPSIMDKIKSADKSQITILEQTGQITNYLNDQLQSKLPNGERVFSFQAVVANSFDWADRKEVLLKKLVAGQTSAVLEIAPPGAPDSVIWHTKRIELGGASTKVSATLQQMTTQHRIQASGLTQTQLTEIFAPINFTVQSEGLKASSQEQQTQNMTLVYFLLFMLYFSLIVYGMYVANGVVEEKSSRVMEMMIGMVKPSSMMTAKILGIGAVGLTQYFLWIGTGLGLLALKGKGISLIPGMTFQLATIEPLYLFYFGVFFILGFLLYASMYAGIGAMVSRPEDTNQAVSPMTFLIVAAFMLAMFSLYSPDNPWIVGLSYVPFFTPMVLFARIVLTDVSILGVLLGILDLLLTTLLLIWIAGKMYRAGVLMYGKVSWRNMINIMFS
ncbi:ABC transporter permease [Desulfosporosinus sp. Sb-LF]|uniref:ABC transporter permease n=1 Tax=Desulfosporosinus sp. Sb-LF TaxID=2560027 RepID=UPI00107F468F|nr:ABC transporter permease [Desulfosporosinus sp. Sb-LF]TGE31402.1 ABC transporter permease [Desulfosporosinus sp. Sb-LF]